jgi:hypothetical protein
MADTLTNDEAKAIIQQAGEDLEKKLGAGTKIVIMASGGTWGYCWNARGDTFGIRGTMDYVSDKIRAWIGDTAK